MIEQVNGFITPMKEWDAVGKNDGKITGTENGTKSVFQSVLEDTVQNVYDTQKDVEQKQYLLATGQLEDAHSLPIAQAKAELSLEVMISLRNKAMEAYNEILKMSQRVRDKRPDQMASNVVALEIPVCRDGFLHHFLFKHGDTRHQPDLLLI